MNISTSDTTRLIRKLRALKLPVDVINMQLLQIAMQSRNRMVTRMKKGISADGKKFESYTPQYAKKRQESGRKLNEDRLVFTGNMMADFQPRISGNREVTVGFVSQEQEKKFEGNQKKYNQFPMTRQEQQAAEKDMVIGLEMLIRERLR